MAVSAMLGLPFVTLITACSKPDDFVNSSTDLFFAARAGCESRSPAPAAAVVRRKSRRVESEFIFYPLKSGSSNLQSEQMKKETGVVYCERQKRASARGL